VKLKARKKKSVAWYRRELRAIAEIANDALENRGQMGPTLVAIHALASEAAIGREAYAER